MVEQFWIFRVCVCVFGSVSIIKLFHSITTTIHPGKKILALFFTIIIIISNRFAWCFLLFQFREKKCRPIFHHHHHFWFQSVNGYCWDDDDLCLTQPFNVNLKRKFQINLNLNLNFIFIYILKLIILAVTNQSEN